MRVLIISSIAMAARPGSAASLLALPAAAQHIAPACSPPCLLHRWLAVPHIQQLGARPPPSSCSCGVLGPVQQSERSFGHDCLNVLRQPSGICNCPALHPPKVYVLPLYTGTYVVWRRWQQDGALPRVTMLTSGACHLRLPGLCDALRGARHCLMGDMMLLAACHCSKAADGSCFLEAWQPRFCLLQSADTSACLLCLFRPLFRIFACRASA